MDDYGFSAGLISRVFRKILPRFPDNNTVEWFLVQNNNDAQKLISFLDLETIEQSNIAKELNLSIKTLCLKVAAFGLDSNIQSKLKQLNIYKGNFETLVSLIEHKEISKKKELVNQLNIIENDITILRKNKNKIGVNLHATVVTRRILEYVIRAKELVDLKLNLNSATHWAETIQKHISYTKEKESLRRFIVRHFDLVILEIVEHTSNKGEKYIAETKKEYRHFFYKSLLGGAIIAIFALAKIFAGSYKLGQFQNAFLFSLNYALCFVLVKQFGGIIATKQPAMTASTLAKNIDKNDNLVYDSIEEILVLIKKVSSSQFVSLAGNFLMALSCACFLYLIAELAGVQDKLGINSKYLITQVSPSIPVILYAATAGVFLALSGLISGYFDNKVVASKITYRISNSRFFLKSSWLANFVEKKGGAFLGNISLGFFLGCAFLLSYLLPFAVDIRHIAFSTSYVGFSMMNAHLEINTLILALSGAILIGIINFLVSFSITLFLALKSRGITLPFLPKLGVRIIKDFVSNPLDYFILKENKSNKV